MSPTGLLLTNRSKALSFRNDPEWQAARDKSEANGKLVEKVESTFLSLTDFSPPIR